MRITFLAAEGCLSSGITNLLDMFAIANSWQTFLTGNPAPLFATEIVTEGGKPILSSGCIQILPHRPLEDVLHTDFILIPPFIPLPDLADGDRTQLRNWIVSQYNKRIPIAAMCTGVFLLAETGLLNGKAATTNWQFARKFRYRFPQVCLQIENLLTEEDGLMCTGAATSFFNLGLKIIDRYGSSDLASACAKALLVDPNRESQTPYCIHRETSVHGDPEVLKAQRYFAENFSTIRKIDDVAGHVHLSPRHFKRRFKRATGTAPIQYLQRIRIEAARKKLETSLETIDEITRHIGYEDSSTFRRLFKNYTKLSPREYRDKFLSI